MIFKIIDAILAGSLFKVKITLTQTILLFGIVLYQYDKEFFFSSIFAAVDYIDRPFKVI
jgi:hypothetical protein